MSSPEERFQIPQQPELSPEEIALIEQHRRAAEAPRPDATLEHESHTYDPNEKHGFKTWHKVAAGLAAATLFGGGGVATAKMHAASNNTPPEKRPVATAPVTPGQTHEASPTANPEAKTWNADTIPILADFNNDGQLETYHGVDEAKEGMRVKAKEDSVSEAEAASKVIFGDRIPQWVNFSNNPKVQQEYTGYTTPSDSSGVQGATAVAFEYVDSLGQEALTSNHVEGVPIQGNIKPLNEEFVTGISNLRQESDSMYGYSLEAGGEPYELQFKVDSVSCKQGVALAAPYGCETVVSYDDNFENTGINKLQKGVDPSLGLTGTGLFHKQQGTMTFNYDLQVQDGSWVMPGVTSDLPPAS